MTDQDPVPPPAGTRERTSGAGIASVTKRVLLAVAQVLPDEGDDHLTKVGISRGWGDVLNVRLHTTLPHAEARQRFGVQVRNAIGEILEDERHHVEIVSGEHR